MNLNITRYFFSISFNILQYEYVYSLLYDGVANVSGKYNGILLLDKILKGI